MKKESITITEEQFRKATAKVLHSDHIDSLIKLNPHLLLAFAMVFAELGIELFKEK